jgi:hypothetical protein
MAYTYPTLTMLPSYPLEEEVEDGTIRTPYEAGYVHTRPKFTRRGRKTWKVNYKYMPTSDKSLLEGFVTSVREGAYTFTWTNPQNSSVTAVRFEELPKYSYVTNTYWDCDFALKEV